jgi:FtsH-binding integral membrane protein
VCLFLLVIVAIQRGVSAVPRTAAVLAVALAVVGLVIIVARVLEPSFGPATGFAVWLIFLLVVLLVANRYGMFPARDLAAPRLTIGGRIVWLYVALRRWRLAAASSFNRYWVTTLGA